LLLLYPVTFLRRPDGDAYSAGIEFPAMPSPPPNKDRAAVRFPRGHSLRRIVAAAAMPASEKRKARLSPGFSEVLG
jgi:hypothetical protein